MELITPGGVLTRQFADGAATMRVCLGLLDQSDDGLLLEMRQDRDPVPWESRRARDEALDAIARRGDLTDDEREGLLRHVRRTPYYES